MEAKCTPNKRHIRTLYILIVSFPINFKRGIYWTRDNTRYRIDLAVCFISILDWIHSPNFRLPFIQLFWRKFKQICDLTYIYKVVRYEVVTAVIMNNTFLLDMTACSMVEVNWRFGEMCSLHYTIEGKTSHSTRKKRGVKFSRVARAAWWLRGLFLDTETGSYKFLRNVDELLTY
jgi:hypothetical protein